MKRLPRNNINSLVAKLTNNDNNDKNNSNNNNNKKYTTQARSGNSIWDVQHSTNHAFNSPAATIFQDLEKVTKTTKNKTFKNKNEIGASSYLDPKTGIVQTKYFDNCKRRAIFPGAWQKRFVVSRKWFQHEQISQTLHALHCAITYQCAHSRSIFLYF